MRSRLKPAFGLVSAVLWRFSAMAAAAGRANASGRDPPADRVCRGIGAGCGLRRSILYVGAGAAVSSGCELLKLYAPSVLGSSKAQELVRSLIAAEPQDRPSWGEIAAHRWLAEQRALA